MIGCLSIGKVLFVVNATRPMACVRLLRNRIQQEARRDCNFTMQKTSVSAFVPSEMLMLPKCHQHTSCSNLLIACL